MQDRARANETKKKAPAGSQPGRARRNQSRTRSRVPSADPRRSVPLALPPPVPLPLRMGIEVELVAERDPGWCALMRWLLSDDTRGFAAFLAGTPGTVEAVDGQP